MDARSIEHLTRPDAMRLEDEFDAVVMLTWSDWKTEPRSNRYHYATRFARHIPVLFVQPDLEEQTYRLESAGEANITILHIYQRYGERQRRLLSTALNRQGVCRPLLWIYNAYFAEFVGCCYAPIKIYHATEDYFATGGSGEPLIAARLRELFSSIDLLVAVSEGVRESYVAVGGYDGDTLVLENGCDYAFWAAGGKAATAEEGAKVAFYQGGINHRLDWKLISEVVARLPHWQFWFCGNAQSHLGDFRSLQRRPNFRYLGALTPEAARDLARRATAGIIPFVREDYIDISMPLKAFEYVACGLPVVSVPIRALKRYPSLFNLADDAGSFAAALEAAAETRYDPAALGDRDALARDNDYDERFGRLLDHIAKFLRTPHSAARATVLVLYDLGSTHVSTLLEHLKSFGMFSRHQILYASATRDATCSYDLDAFDAVIMHYSIRVSLEDHLSPSYASALAQYAGLKVLFMQDEYDTAETARRWIERLGIQMVYSCAPDDCLEVIYPKPRFAKVQLIRTLTGYAPSDLRAHTKPHKDRRVLIGYRGRKLPFWYGELGREKELIGAEVRKACEKKGLPVDIEWDDSKRIYGAAWYRFLEGANATLGTESGSNVLDEYGSIRAGIEAAQRARPDISYAEIRERFLAREEGRIRMNQISPKIFEAIACRTALVLFEGDYSGVVEPGRHFLPLKKDFSNLDEILEKLQDPDLLEEMTTRAFDDIIKSGKYSYRRFIQTVDEDLGIRIRKAMRTDVIGVMRAERWFDGSEWQSVRWPAAANTFPTTVPMTRKPPAEPISPLQSLIGEGIFKVLQPIWHALPAPMRRTLQPIANTILRIRAHLLRKFSARRQGL